MNFRRLVAVFIVALASVLGTTAFSWPGPCNQRCDPEMSIRKLVDRADVIFIGTVSDVEPRDYKIANDKTDELFYANNQVTFAVQKVLKGSEMSSITIKGSDLFGLYKGGKQFLIFLHPEDKKGFRLDPSRDAFLVGIDVENPRYHWKVGVRGGKRPPAEYGPYILRFDINSSLWMAGDIARWPLSLQKDVHKELVALDPQFANRQKAAEAFSLTTRGCHWLKDEWPAPYIGWTPCPMPLSLVEAYIKVLARQ